MVDAGSFQQRGQRLRTAGIDEDTADLAQRVVSGGAGDRQRRIQGLIDGEDLLDHDPRVGAGQLAQPAEIAGRIRQSVGMVDAHPVDESVGEPARHLGVAGVEHHAIFLAQPGQRRDREEAAIPAQPVAPADQPVMLAVVDFGAGAIARAGRDGKCQIAQP